MALTPDNTLALTVTCAEAGQHWCTELILIWGTLKKNTYAGTAHSDSDLNGGMLQEREDSEKLPR